MLSWSRGNALDCGATGPWSDSRLWPGVLCLLYVFLWLRVNFRVQNTLFAMNFSHYVCDVTSYSILYILQNLWPILRISTYRSSIFKEKSTTCILFCKTYFNVPQNKNIKIYFQKGKRAWYLLCAKFELELYSFRNIIQCHMTLRTHILQTDPLRIVYGLLPHPIPNTAYQRWWGHPHKSTSKISA